MYTHALISLQFACARCIVLGMGLWNSVSKANRAFFAIAMWSAFLLSCFLDRTLVRFLIEMCVFDTHPIPPHHIIMMSHLFLCWFTGCTRVCAFHEWSPAIPNHIIPFLVCYHRPASLIIFSLKLHCGFFASLFARCAVSLIGPSCILDRMCRTVVSWLRVLRGKLSKEWLTIFVWFIFSSTSVNILWMFYFQFTNDFKVRFRGR